MGKKKGKGGKGGGDGKSQQTPTQATQQGTVQATLQGNQQLAQQPHTSQQIAQVQATQQVTQQTPQQSATQHQQATTQQQQAPTQHQQATTQHQQAPIQHQQAPTHQQLEQKGGSPWGRGQPLGRGKAIPQQQQLKQPGGRNVSQSSPTQSISIENVEKGRQEMQAPLAQGVASIQLEQKSITPQKNVSRANEKELEAQMAAPKQELMPLVQRRGVGKKGKPVVVETNHLLISFRPSETLVHHYDVTIVPDKLNRMLRPVVAAFVKLVCPRRNPAYDGKKNLYSFGALPFGETCSKVIELEVDVGREMEFTIDLKLVKKLDFQAITNFMKSPTNLAPPKDALQAVDVVMRHSAAQRLVKVGRSFFSPPKEDQIVDLGNGIELWVGTFQSAVLGWKPFLNVDVVHKGFPKNQKVLNLILDLNSRLRLEDLETNELAYWQVDELNRYLKGLKIEYEIPGIPSSKRTYKVNSVKDSAERQMFNTKDDNSGQMLSVAEYFHKERRFRLKYPKMPCLHVGNITRTIYVPIEFCTVVAGQVTMKKLDEKQTAAMIKHAATPPYIRKKKIMEANNRLGLKNDPCMREFGITISDALERVPARILDAPLLQYKDGAKETVTKGAWRADGQQFHTPGTIKKWCIINLDRSVTNENMRNFDKLFCQEGNRAGLQIPPCSEMITLDARNKKVVDARLSNLIDCSIVIVIVPDKGDSYGFVKQLAELKYGILTQCVKAFTFSRKMNYSTAKNILLKVNAKLNGVNHALHIQSRPPIFKQPVIIMGADVTHPSPDARNSPSIAAVTASHDPQAFKYNIEWRLQPPRQEIIQDLEEITRNQLLFFYRSTKYQPSHIVFYRDGVSDGQFEMVLSQELRAIRAACSRLSADYKPRITFLVVQKRHHTRFFPTRPEDSDGTRNQNVPPGLVVDTAITHPRDMDFYLVSHQSIQGTSRPTKYCVLHDDANMSEDDVEELTYYLCHLFSRCNRSVSYPAPTYYAHLAAFRAKAYFEGENINLDQLRDEQARRTIKEQILRERPMFFV